MEIDDLISKASDSNIQNNDLSELSLTEGIQVWGAKQETLEEQALKELSIFSDENNKHTEKHQTIELEEGEIVETTTSKITGKLPEPSLDLTAYIKAQEALKKRQAFQKTLACTRASKEIADRISKKLERSIKKRKKTVLVNNELAESVKTNDITKNDNNALPEIEQEDLEELQIAPKRRKKSKNKKHSKGEDAIISDILEENDAIGTGSDIDDTQEDTGSEYVPSENELDYDSGNDKPKKSENLNDPVSNILKKTKRKHNLESLQIKKFQDDGLLKCYKSRLKLYYKKLEEEQLIEEEFKKGVVNESDEEDIATDQVLKAGLKVPIKTWNKLYSYQQDGIKWLWRIHRKATGGILGDEMGLGKTVQIIAFLLSLENSRVISCHGRFNGLGPTLIVCPATVINQWVQHFHEWAPEFRVAVLHQSGSYQGDKVDLIKEIHKSKGIIVTTYIGILKFKTNLLEYNWHYLILDEGHKIRNPTAKVSVAVKHIRTPHRILLTGSPMQNNLVELWSLFDFTNPGMLGNMTTFQEHFSTPILQGGFANSTPMQEATALSVATTLKDLITPFLLRRSKAEVQHHILLPNKSEQVLFCSLSDEQKDLYKGYLLSDHVSSILGKGSKQWFSDNHMRANVLVAITTLRKICNHPDIYMYEAGETEKCNSESMEEDFGYYKKSGKMIVVSALLKIWKKQGHRVLLFTQGRSMIAIFTKFLQQQGYKYLKMDGSTSISSRQPLIDKFNQDESYDVFLSTTRVGGLGVNLTGANRVIIYDPDWNPATDTQARERAWRIGQDKQVTIYRLLSAGTIEEKMYQRQVWKQLLSNKVLLDPKTSRFFKSSDLHDLFSLQESHDANPETANIFHDSRVRIQKNMEKGKKKKKIRTQSENSENSDVRFTEDKIQAMKNLAAQIAKSLSQTQHKTGTELDFEEERQKKLQEKAELKKLTPQALFHYNKDKANAQEDPSVNKIDDSIAKVGFSEALKYSEQTAKLHHALVSGKTKEPDKITKKVDDIKKKVIKEDQRDPLEKYKKESAEATAKLSKKNKKKKDKDKVIVDKSGTIDGEEVSGLVRTEVKKIKKDKQQEVSQTQDDFVLGKLFERKGVSGALQHDSIIQSGSQGGNLRIHTEARMRAEKSLEALRKSRLDNWRW